MPTSRPLDGLLVRQVLLLPVLVVYPSLLKLSSERPNRPSRSVQRLVAEHPNQLKIPTPATLPSRVILLSRAKQVLALLVFRLSWRQPGRQAVEMGAEWRLALQAAGLSLARPNRCLSMKVSPSLCYQRLGWVFPRMHH